MNDQLQIKELKRTLSGRIILKIYQEITGKTNHIASNEEILDYIKKGLSENLSDESLFKISVLTTSPIIGIKCDSLNFPSDMDQLLIELGQKPLLHPILLLVSECPIPFPKEVFFSVNCQQYKDKTGYVYTIFGMDETGPNEILINLEVDASIKKKSSKIKFISEVFTSENGILYLNLCISILEYINTNPIGTFDYFGPSNNNFAPNSNPPKDEHLIELLVEAGKTNKGLKKGLVDFDIIEPFSYNFCLNYPDKYINHAQSYISEIMHFGLLVYEEDGKFIMSDMYPSYLALKKEGKEKIKVVVVGESHIPLDEIELGGMELIPPGLPALGSIDSASKEYKEELLNDRIKELSKLSKIEKLEKSKGESVKNKIGNAKIEEAFDDLLLYIEQKEIRDGLFLLLGRYSKFKRDSRKGIISKEFEFLEYNRITDSLLQLINEIEE